MNNKLIIYLIILLFLASSALSIGIGAKNEKIYAEGIQKKEFFIINDGNKDTDIKIGFIGSEKGVKIEPDTMHLSPEDNIKKFEITLDFGEINNYQNLKIFVSETADQNSAVMASANVIYNLPIEKKENDLKEDSEKDSQTETSSTKNIGKKEKEEGEVNAQTPSDKEGVEKTPLKSETSETEKSQESEKEELSNTSNIALLSAVILILSSLLMLDILFLRRKTPLEKYVKKARKAGKSDDEIRENLKEAGWSELIIESNLKK